jgi:hypothetical protein
MVVAAMAINFGALATSLRATEATEIALPAYRRVRKRSVSILSISKDQPSDHVCVAREIPAQAGA